MLQVDRQLSLPALVCLYTGMLLNVRDAKSEEHEERAPAIFPPSVLIFGLPTQKIC